MENEKIISSQAPVPVGAYPHARRVGNLLFLSGIGARNPLDNSIAGLKLDEQGNIIDYDFEAQVHQVFQNVKAVLQQAGATWEDLVDITVFLINMKRDFATFNKIYAQYFTQNQPCRTTVEVKALPTPIAIELKCIAVVT
ncbi:MAG: Rid family detoxifying hydrolase [Flammeovirgaceae bacterium]|nr:Rid family detoxifying hydrolase [Flammeovirgaceae bacterium]MDW8288720.1 Rid family detoxifying hydrolase [Flammeovirgaceae bacterium]